ncbi:hypothetical protein Pcinc_034542 [Petrolisthes cinctipes]|uniref:Uncharacterized protein n=1 Tax=Petrolisthes cinctipes TaxID=88211 RepID=A0AAE1BYN0_PETCI|nr:hypothetical protein Pcinc_034542 [Petrolisthes cinctipes]
MVLKEELASEEAKAAQEERGALTSQLKEAMTRLQLLNTKLRELTHNYVALAHIIETKNKLAEEVKQVRSELQSTQLSMKEQVATLKAEIENVREEGKHQLHRMMEQEKTKSRELLEKSTVTLHEKISEVEEAKVMMKDVQKSHHKELTQIQEQNMREQEQLRGRLAQLKQNLSSRSLSNLDLFTSKLQATREEYEERLKEQTSKVETLETELGNVKEELTQAQETLKHQSTIMADHNIFQSYVTTNNTNNKGYEKKEVVF